MLAPARKQTRHFAAALLAVALLIPGPPSTAGTAADPEITDGAGDANYINGQRKTTCLRPETCPEPGAIPGTNPLPASVDELDLAAVWFETEYETTQVRDPATGEVSSVRHDPTALAIHIQTEAPAWPVPAQWASLGYRIPVTLPQCNAYFELGIRSGGNHLVKLTAGTPFGGLTPDCDLQKEPGQPDYRTTFISPVHVTFEGTVATLRFRLVDQVNPVWRFIPVGTAISQPYAFSDGSLQVAGTGGLIADETSVGRDFAIGQDVPPDVECSEEPDYPGCEE
jgi:hypothetical protein